MTESVTLPFGENGPLQDNYEEECTFSQIRAVEEDKYIVFYALDSSDKVLAKLLKVSREDGVIYLFKHIPPELGFRLDEYGCIQVESPSTEDYDFELDEDTDELIPTR